MLLTATFKLSYECSDGLVAATACKYEVIRSLDNYLYSSLFRLNRQQNKFNKKKIRLRTWIVTYYTILHSPQQ